MGNGSLCIRRYGQVSYKAPIAARIHLNIADVLAGNDNIGLIPQRKHRQLAAHDFLDLRVEHQSSLTVKVFSASSNKASSSLLLYRLRLREGRVSVGISEVAKRSL